jgi:hypothetical protein
MEPSAMTHPKDPLPKVPATFTAPKFEVSVKQNGTMELPGYFPFYYAAIQSVWVYWRVERTVLDEYLRDKGMKAARFSDGGDTGLVNINFFNAAALYGAGQPGNPGVGGFNETEVNIVGYASAVEASVPTSYTLEAFVTGADQTKRIGVYRVWVACDNAVAVAAGQQRYFENKFLVAYDYNVPSLNNDPSQSEYQWTCYDPAEIASEKTPTTFIYRAAVNLAGLTPQPGNMSEWVDLSYDDKAKRVVASRRNYLGMYDTYLLSRAPADPVSIEFGTSKHPMRTDMQRLIGARPAFAIQRFVSPPVIAEAAPYYADL